MRLRVSVWLSVCCRFSLCISYATSSAPSSSFSKKDAGDADEENDNERRATVVERKDIFTFIGFTRNVLFRNAERWPSSSILVLVLFVFVATTGDQTNRSAHHRQSIRSVFGHSTAWSAWFFTDRNGFQMEGKTHRGSSCNVNINSC